jgi:hypothetical protein
MVDMIFSYLQYVSHMIVIERVTYTLAIFLEFDQSHIPEDAELMRYGRLRHTELFRYLLNVKIVFRQLV